MRAVVRRIELPYAGTVIIEYADGIFESVGGVEFPDLRKVRLPSR